MAGCRNQLGFDLTPAYNPDLPLRVVGTADGERFSCEAVAVDPQHYQQPTCSAAGADLDVRHHAGTDEWHAELFLYGVPCEVQFQVEQAGVVVAEAAATPTYELNAPNGLACGPLCWQATGSIVVTR